MSQFDSIKSIENDIAFYERRQAVLLLSAKRLLPYVEFKRSEQPTPALPFRVTYTLDQVREWIVDKSPEEIGIINVIILHRHGRVWMMVQDGCHRVEGAAELDKFVLVQVEIYGSASAVAAEYSPVTLEHLLQHPVSETDLLYVLKGRQVSFAGVFHNEYLHSMGCGVVSKVEYYYLSRHENGVWITLSDVKISDQSDPFKDVDSATVQLTEIIL